MVDWASILDLPCLTDAKEYGLSTETAEGTLILWSTSIDAQNYF